MVLDLLIFRLKSIATTRQSPLPTDVDFVSTAREILLMAQNDRRTAITLKQLIRDKKGPESDKDDDDALSGFMHLLDQVHLASKERILVPIKTYIQEVQDLCQSIHMHQKFDKIARKLKASLEEIEEARAKVKEIKMKEKGQLEAAISAIRQVEKCNPQCNATFT